MKATLVVASLILGTAVPAAAKSPTSWELYLDTLDPVMAAATTSMGYSESRSAEERLRDLLLLETQVTAGDVEAYRLALRLASKASPGETLETLAEMIGKVVRTNPQVFLREQANSTHCFGIDFLGPSFVDRSMVVRKHEIAMRIKAIQSVQEPSLRKIQQVCIATLR